MVQKPSDPFSALAKLHVGLGEFLFFRLSRLEELGLVRIAELPYSIRVLLESVLRQCDGFSITEEDVTRLARWCEAKGRADLEIPFKPARVILQDFTGVPALVDLAAMRSAIHRLGGEPSRVNPLIPVDLVIDHSVQVDFFGSPDALEKNIRLEFERNRERYEFLRWGQESFSNLRVVPPAAGIIHQINLEYLAQCVIADRQRGLAYPDTVVGTDSHTTMINGLGVLGWGVGGIEAEAAMLGQPMYMLAPEVVGVELIGELREGVTPTDLVLTVTELLRKEGVVGKFVEFFGGGVSQMPVYDRAVLANMAPEYGATMGFFPVDSQTLAYLRETGRPKEHIDLVEWYCKEQGLFREEESPIPAYTKVLRLDLSTVEGSVAGPKRPQDRVPITTLAESFQAALTAPIEKRGFGLSAEEAKRRETVALGSRSFALGHGSVVIAAITSCTNTSNPKLMVAAGLLAKKACQRGLKVPPFVKTSLAPGSRVVTEYLQRLGLIPFLENLGFAVVGYGCTTCIGNSGPLPEPVAEAIRRGRLVVAAVLSGNRNFEGRIHPAVKANYLASPPLVVALALAGRVDCDLSREPIGYDGEGRPVFLREIWPSQEEVIAALKDALSPELFQQRYQDVFEGDQLWKSLNVQKTELFPWSDSSTYIHEPPYFDGMSLEPAPPPPIRSARVLLALGDSVTTDHISPAGSIPKDSPAGRFLMDRGVRPEDFNTYGARRGNDQVMVRGTFANIRLRNHLVPDREGGVTRYWPTGEVLSVYEAAIRYKEAGVPLVVLAGAEYGTGSSRDWAAKGTALLGVRAVLAASFERIHRSNLVGMGVLPLQFPVGQTWQSLGLTGEEVIDIMEPSTGLQPRGSVEVLARKTSGETIRFTCQVRIDTPVELEYYLNGGILPMVLRKLLKS